MLKSLMTFTFCASLDCICASLDWICEDFDCICEPLDWICTSPVCPFASPAHPFTYPVHPFTSPVRPCASPDSMFFLSARWYFENGWTVFNDRWIEVEVTLLGWIFLSSFYDCDFLGAAIKG